MKPELSGTKMSETYKEGWMYLRRVTNLEQT